MIFDGFDGIAKSRSGGNSENVTKSTGSAGDKTTKIEIDIGDSKSKRSGVVGVLKAGFDSITTRGKFSLGSLADGVGKAVRGRGFFSTSDVNGTHLDVETRRGKVVGLCSIWV